MRGDIREQRRLEARFDKSEVDALVVTASRQRIEKPLLGGCVGCQRLDNLSDRRRRCGNPLKSHKPGDLFDEITLDRQIKTMRRNYKAQRLAARRLESGALTRDAEALQQCGGFVSTNRETKQSLDLRHAQRHRRITLKVDRLFNRDHRAGFTTCHQLQQASGTLDRLRTDLGIDATFKALTSIGRQTKTATATGNRRGREPGDFEQHAAGLSGYRRARATHHARERYRPRLVGDDEHVGL